MINRGAANSPLEGATRSVATFFKKCPNGVCHGFLAVEKWKANFEIVMDLIKATLNIQDTCPCHHSWTFEDS
jgi:hypothetical protein